MLYREIIAVCSEIHTKHINALHGQNVEFSTFNPVVHKVTAIFYRVNPLRPSGYYTNKVLTLLQVDELHFMPGQSLMIK